MDTQARGHAPTWLQVLMSMPPFRYSTTLSRLPALAARRKLALLSDCGREKAVSGPPDQANHSEEAAGVDHSSAEPHNPRRGSSFRLSRARSPWDRAPPCQPPNLKWERRHCLTVNLQPHYPNPLSPVTMLVTLCTANCQAKGDQKTEETRGTGCLPSCLVCK